MSVKLSLFTGECLLLSNDSMQSLTLITGLNQLFFLMNNVRQNEILCISFKKDHITALYVILPEIVHERGSNSFS